MKQLCNKKWVLSGIVGATLWSAIPALAQTTGEGGTQALPSTFITEDPYSDPAPNSTPASGGEGEDFEDILQDASRAEESLDAQELRLRRARCEAGQTQVRQTAFARIHSRLEEDRNGILNSQVDNGYAVLGRMRDRFNRIQERLFQSGALERRGEQVVSRYSNVIEQLRRLNRARELLVRQGQTESERYRQLEDRTRGLLYNLDSIYGVALAPELHNGHGSTSGMGECPQNNALRVFNPDLTYHVNFRSLVSTLGVDGSSQYAIMGIRSFNLASAARYMLAEANMAEPNRRQGEMPGLSCRNGYPADAPLRPLHVQVTRLVWDEKASALFALSCDFDRRYFDEESSAEFVSQCAHMNLITMERSDLTNIHATLDYPGVAEMQPSEFRLREQEIAELRRSEFANCESLLYPPPPRIVIPTVPAPTGPAVGSSEGATLVAPTPSTSQSTETAPPVVAPPVQPVAPSTAATSTPSAEADLPPIAVVVPATPPAPVAPTPPVAPAPLVSPRSEIPAVVITQGPAVVPAQPAVSSGTVFTLGAPGVPGAQAATPAPTTSVETITIVRTDGSISTTSVTLVQPRVVPAPAPIDCAALIQANHGNIPSFEPQACIGFFDGIRAEREAQRIRAMTQTPAARRQAAANERAAARAARDAERAAAQARAEAERAVRSAERELNRGSRAEQPATARPRANGGAATSGQRRHRAAPAPTPAQPVVQPAPSTPSATVAPQTGTPLVSSPSSTQSTANSLIQRICSATGNRVAGICR